VPRSLCASDEIKATGEFIPISQCRAVQSNAKAQIQKGTHYASAKNADSGTVRARCIWVVPKQEPGQI
jgi:hypothetical protein